MSISTVPGDSRLKLKDSRTFLVGARTMLLDRSNRNGHRGTRESLRAWLKGFAECVRAQDFTRGRTYFHPHTTWCFGSYAETLDGLDDLVARQWKKIWPNITGFRFDLSRLRYSCSPDGRQLCAMVLWRSTGYRGHQPFKRTGRLTIVLTRAAVGAPWMALHTHYSLTPGVAQTAVPSDS
jgi:hypothetical protein